MERLKKEYENAEIELVRLKYSDVITTSNEDDRPDLGDLDDWSKT